MQSLSLHSPARGGATPFWHWLPSVSEHQQYLGERRSYQIPPSQLQPPTLQERAASGQLLSSEPPRRPPTRRSDDNTSPLPYAGQIFQPRFDLMPDSRIPPQPAGHIALSLAIYEAHPRRDDPLNLARPARRNCSIIAQCNPHSDKFREFCCIFTPQRWPRRHVLFYSSPEIPNPRWTAPGLLAMYFIAWVPYNQVAELDRYMITWRRRVNNTWDHRTWIDLYLRSLVEKRLITPVQRNRATVLQAQALSCRYTENFPNARRCFPHLY